jgi:hypothetical protein
MRRPMVQGRFFVIALLVSACASTGGSRGKSGPVEWEVVDLRRSVTSDGQAMRWDFVVVLRETAGETVTFEKVVSRLVPSSSHPDAVYGAVREEPFTRVLGPHAELRLNMSNALRFSQGAFAGSIAMRGSFARRWQFVGKDDVGKPVTADVVVTFNPS